MTADDTRRRGHTAGVKAVAAAAGVSLGTVSNVLNRPELVSPLTRAKVEAAMASLGFVRNESARQLRAGSSRIVAYLMLDAGNPFFTDVAKGVEEAARAAGLSVFLCNSNEDAEPRGRLPRPARAATRPGRADHAGRPSTPRGCGNCPRAVRRSSWSTARSTTAITARSR